MALTVRVIAVTPTTEVPVKAVGIAENLSVTIETVFNKFVSVMFKTRTVLRMSQVKLKDVYWASWSFTIYWWTHLTDCILKERSTEAQLNCFLCQMLLLQNITKKRFYFLESDFPSHEWHLVSLLTPLFSVQQPVLSSRMFINTLRLSACYC